MLFHFYFVFGVCHQVSVVSCYSFTNILGSIHRYWGNAMIASPYDCYHWTKYETNGEKRPTEIAGLMYLCLCACVNNNACVSTVIRMMCNILIPALDARVAPSVRIDCSVELNVVTYLYLRSVFSTIRVQGLLFFMVFNFVFGGTELSVEWYVCDVPHKIWLCQRRWRITQIYGLSFVRIVFVISSNQTRQNCVHILWIILNAIIYVIWPVAVMSEMIY